ncbi:MULTISPECIES: hypothetical protein [Sphingomonadaceae]|uniref:hypothetical protein n=1 Tax=Sphingomonadales TaxID=204457 RepID=UPI0021C3A8FB|nr:MULTISPECIES: hypothetical protein [Sphingomonadaceae]WCP12318.1 hypothetical protein sphantq_00715 [Sphingobium sp. AntQ-1]
MEENRPGQHPDADQRPAGQGVHERAAPVSPASPPSGKERAVIDEAQWRADQDRATSRATGHGDHKGEDGF